MHRDVKPANVLLGRNGDVKLADFGIAKRLDDYSSELTGTGHFVGTPKYLAPEQLSGEPATAATDLYATGVVLYEMLAGTAPFDGGAPMATAVAHQTAPVPDLRAARPDVPPHVAGAVSKAMAKDPADRFQTAAAMRAALAGARPPSAAGAAPVPTRSTGSAIWWIVPAVLLLAVGALAIAFGRDDDDPSSTVSSTAPPSRRHRRRAASDGGTEHGCARRPAPTTAPATNPPTTAAPVAPQTDRGARRAARRQSLTCSASGRTSCAGTSSGSPTNEATIPGVPAASSRTLAGGCRTGELSPDVLPLLDQLVGPLAARRTRTTAMTTDDDLPARPQRRSPTCRAAEPVAPDGGIMTA